MIMKVVVGNDKLSKYYGKRGEIEAVDELDLEVFEGETFGLLRPNGAAARCVILLGLECVKHMFQEFWCSLSQK